MMELFVIKIRGKAWTNIMEQSTQNRPDLISKIIGFFCIALFAVIILSKCIYLFDLVPNLIAVVGSVFIVTLCVVVIIKYDYIISKINIFFTRINGIGYGKLIIFIAIISLITKFIAVMAFHINSIDDHSDINVYVTTSKELADYGMVKQYANYCNSFSHMFWYAVFLTPVTKLFGISQLAYSIYLSITLTLVCALVFDTMSFLYSKAIAFSVAFLFCILPSQILLPQYVTHEIASMFFLFIGIWLYFKISKQVKKRYLKIIAIVGSFVSFFLCSQMNSIGLIAMIALTIILIIELIRCLSKRTIMSFAIKIVSLLLIFIIGSVIFNAFQINHSKITREKNNKVLWTLYVGSNYEHNGEWFPDKKWDDYPENYSNDEIDDYHMALISQQYKELISSPQKLLSLIKHKITVIWGNFSYSIGYTNETIPNESISKFYNQYLFKPLTFIEYLVLLLLAVFGLASLIRNKSAKKEYLIVFTQLYLLGTTSLLLLTECRNKYTISLIPIFLIICIASSSNFEKS